MTQSPVVVIGAGPQGLAAAAHLVERGIEPLVLEQGGGPAAAVSEWGHVRLFSAWAELMDAAALRLLESKGGTAPPNGYPLGSEWVRDYLAPLATALGRRVRYGTTVTGVARLGRDLMVDSGRSAQPFLVHASGPDGGELRIPARAVLDASGTWFRPNPAGADGYPATGERAAAEHTEYRIPDGVSQFEGKHLVVIGSGHSAAHTLIRLAGLVKRTSGTRVTWLLRRGSTANVFGSAGDQLPERGALGGRAREVIEDGSVDLVTGFRVAAFRRHGGSLSIVAEDGSEVVKVDHVFALTGFRPELSFLSELRLAVDPGLQSVAGLAAEIDPNLHSCGTVAATGAAELAQPEPDFYIVGAKSYGRAPTFLALTGYEQVRSVVAEVAGDHEAAMRNELRLPETGVCGGAGDLDGGVGCCGAPRKQLIQLGKRAEIATA